ncbi:MAG: ABC transporter permease [Parvularculaceae bacterium]
MKGFSRIWAIFVKELVHLRRDGMTLAIILCTPLLQMTLFGFAINTDPRHLPAAVELRDEGPLTRSFLATLSQSSYIDLVARVSSSEEGERLLRSGAISYLIIVPERFESDFVRGARPEILIAADATDPVAASGALNAVGFLAAQAFEADLMRLPPRFAASGQPPYKVILHRQYNPAGKTAFNTVPGLMGVILSLTLILIASIALARETESGTIEGLLSRPVGSFEVMIGKTTPYILVGAFQAGVVLLGARLVFGIPFSGDPAALAVGLALFISVNLMTGYLISTFCQTQLQAMQVSFFLFLPILLLSGFVFPFAAMPDWAQGIGECMPITHFLRLVREVMLKGAGFADVKDNLWPLALMLGIAAALSLARFRQTLG